jgi:DNA repair protein RecO (recombination protein O)
MALRTDQGIVLRSYPFGESHKVVVLISANRGKLRTVAKGVRKTKSRFGGRLEPFTHVEVVLYEGRELDTITQVEVIEAFPHLRLDLDAVGAAATMTEVVDLVSQEDEPSSAAFLALRRGLTALEAGERGPDVLSVFLLSIADALGLAPALDHCASCGGPAPARFSFPAGGAVCDACAPGGSVRLRPGVLEHLTTLRRGADPDPATADDALGVVRRFVEYHLERRLGSVGVLS